MISQFYIHQVYYRDTIQANKHQDQKTILVLFFEKLIISAV